MGLPILLWLAAISLLKTTAALIPKNATSAAVAAKRDFRASRTNSPAAMIDSSAVAAKSARPRTRPNPGT